MRNAIVTGGSRGLGLGIARRLVNSGFRVIVVARTESEELGLAKRQAEESGESLHFVSSDLADIESIPDLVKEIAAGLRSDLRPGEQRRYEHRRRSRSHVYLSDRAGGALEYDLAHRAHQVRRPGDDGRWWGTNREHILDHRLHRLQRPLGIRRNQGIAGRLHPVTCSGGGSNGRECERGRSWFRQHRHDSRDDGRAASSKSHAAAH